MKIVKRLLIVLLLLPCLFFVACDFTPSDDGSNEDEQQSVTPHEHSYSQMIVDPTEDSDGYTLHICNCGEEDGEYKDNYTILLSFESVLSESVTDDALVAPQLQDRIVYKDTNFDGVVQPNDLVVENYFLVTTESLTPLQIGDKLTRSVKIKVVWTKYVKPHNHDYTTQVIDPTENSDGYTLHTCECGDSYKTDYTILITYESAMANSENVTAPAIQNKIVPKGSEFEGVANIDGFEVVGYKICLDDAVTDIESGYILTTSTIIRVLWSKQHTHNYTETVVDPTENSDGYTLHTCECGDSYKTDYTILITYESLMADGESGVAPEMQNRIVSKGSLFEGIENVLGYDLDDFILNDGTAWGGTIYIGMELDHSIKITVYWKINELYDTLVKLNKLLEISKQYNQTGYVVRALQYIRTAGYNSNSWDLVAGSMNSDFITYVANNQGTIDVVSLRSKTNLTDHATLANIDFIHMFATMNACLYESGIINMIYGKSNANDLAGWGGDLAQLVGNIKTNTSNVSKYELAKNLFNSENGGFNRGDVLGDFDAVNIMARYNIAKQWSYESQNDWFGDGYDLLVNVICDYYQSLSSDGERIEEFANNILGNDYSYAFSQEDSITYLSNIISNRVTNNGLIQTWCSQNNISTTTDKELFDICAKVFAEYLLMIN